MSKILRTYSISLRFFVAVLLYVSNLATLVGSRGLPPGRNFWKMVTTGEIFEKNSFSEFQKQKTWDKIA